MVAYGRSRRQRGYRRDRGENVRNPQGWSGVDAGCVAPVHDRMPDVTASSPTEAVSCWRRASRAGPEHPPLGGDGATGVAVGGAGFTGLWTAIALTDTDPSLRVTILEAETIGYGASGRNGGFCQASLTHGLANGLRHFPDELAILDAEGLANLAAIEAFVRDNGIDCDFERTGDLSVADQPYQVDELKAWVDEAAEWGEELEFLDRAAIREEVHSPLWQAGLFRPPEQGRDALLDPAKLVRGLARVASERGIAIRERSRVESVERRRWGVDVRTATGASLRADHVVVATSAYSGWLRRLSSQFVPV